MENNNNTQKITFTVNSFQYNISYCDKPVASCVDNLAICGIVNDKCTLNTSVTACERVTDMTTCNLWSKPA